ncbi:MAG: DUF58 domain-containing protein [Acidimicrobiales bacterium]
MTGASAQPGSSPPEAGSPSRPGLLLDPSLLARLEALALASRQRLSGALAGEHRSRRHGASVDFADHRQYHPGDDLRRVDWFLYARSDQLTLKLFDAEDDRGLHLVVDTSASMAEGQKLPTAARLAAALGFVSLVQRDPVTVNPLVLSGTGFHPSPPVRFRGRAGVPRLFSHLAGLVAAGPSPLGATARALAARPGPAGSTVIVSDLLTPEWESVLDVLGARRGEVTVVHVLSPGDLDPGLDQGPSTSSRRSGERGRRHDRGPFRRPRGLGAGGLRAPGHGGRGPADNDPMWRAGRAHPAPFPDQTINGHANRLVGGDVELIDNEGGPSVVVSLTPEVLSRYRQTAQRWTQSVAAASRRAGARYLLVRTDDDLEATLFDAWRQAGLLR